MKFLGLGSLNMLSCGAAHKFSITLRSGELPGQSHHTQNPLEEMGSMVRQEVCASVSSCIKTARSCLGNMALSLRVPKKASKTFAL